MPTQPQQPVPYPRPSRLVLGSLDDHHLHVEAQYNPKEIDLGITVGWEDHKGIQGRIPRDTTDIVDLEYTGLPPRTMSLELLFDGYEENKSIEPIIRKLQQLSSPRDEQSTEKKMRRPHLCVVAWCNKEFPTFRCVIESIAVKYTMFGKDGRALRATCAVKLKETGTTRQELRDGIDFQWPKSPDPLTRR
jgi:hypothetical protein